ncbi:MAG: 30S ribosomal protein S12 methylthiotransferase RimO [bacterium]
MLKKPSIGLINLGCAKNLVDAEVMLGILKEHGYEINLVDNEADILIVNTCSFIKDAEKESVRAIVEIAEAGKKLVISGCLAQKYKSELMDAVPEALAFVGTGDIGKIAQIVDSLITNNKKDAIFEITDNPVYLPDFNTPRHQITMGPFSYIKIAEGCDYKCGYCVIPALRGHYRSRTIESIVKEARALGKKGVQEIVLIAQDTSSYGKDIYGKTSLAVLLEKLNDVEEISWIRVMYAFPSLINNDVIKAMATLEKVVKYVDIPLQHSHPEMLKLMLRPAMNNSDVINKLRDNIPDVAIRTAFIVGYPGETEEHYEHLYNFIAEHRFEKLGVFEYSKEKNTYSYGLKPHILAKVKKQRRKELMILQQNISTELHQGLVGKEVLSIVETIDQNGKIIGRTYRDAPEIDGLIYIKSKQDLLPGDIVNVKITKGSAYDLYGSC